MVEFDISFRAWLADISRHFIRAVKSELDSSFDIFFLFFFPFCSITSVADNLQQWPWAPYLHTRSSPFSSLSGGNEDVCARLVSVCHSNCFFTARGSYHVNAIQ